MQARERRLMGGRGQLAHSLHHTFLRAAQGLANIAKIHVAGNAVCPMCERRK